MQPTPSRTRFVTAARAPSRVSESGRGLAPRLSPTQTDSKNGLASAFAASASISATLVTPKKTPRCGSVKPIMSSPRAGDSTAGVGAREGSLEEMLPRAGLRPSSPDSSRVSPQMAWFLGGVCVIAGGAVIAASILADDARMEAPRWVVSAAGAAFVLAGLALVKSYAFDHGVEQPAEDWNPLLGVLVCTCFTAIVGSSAFGPGNAQFRFSGILLFMSLPPGATEWLGRAVFGLGALLVGLITLVFWWRLLRVLHDRSARERLKLGAAFLAIAIAALVVLH